MDNSVTVAEAAPVERPADATPAIRRWIKNQNTEKYISDACISDIFSQVYKINQLGEHVIIHPGVTYVRNEQKAGPIEQFYRPLNNKRGKRKPIIEFSDKSRRNMMCTMAKIEDRMEYWQDVTFADDVMTGLSINQKAKRSSQCMKELKQWMEREGLNIHGIWKREWVKRKSGDLKGKYIPHIHMIYSMPNSNQDTYIKTAIRIAEAWVNITGTNEKEKSLRVALHPNSYRVIESRKQAQKYMSKYLLKNEKFKADESIGRSWGRIGSPKIGVGDRIDMTETEIVMFKRCLRKMAKKAKGHFKSALKNKYSTFFMFIERSTVVQYIEWLRVSYSFEDVPF